MPDFDTIVIGAGAGGLTAALALAQAGQQVLVLEQHYLPGGWTHSFSLGGHRFSPGVHYIGGLGPGGPLRAVYEGLGLGGEMVFCELNPDGIDHVLVGDRRFDICKGKERLVERLSAQFPHEQAGIRGYLDAVGAMASELETLARARTLTDRLRLPLLLPTMIRWGLRPLDRLLHHHIDDPLLRTVLAIQCGDHGLPPSRVPAALHCGVMNHYLDGGWYPMGGGRSIPRAFVRALKAAGGELRLRTPVAQVLIGGAGATKRAYGVRLQDGSEISAHRVISNADPGITFGQLVDPAHQSPKLQRKLAAQKWSVTCLSLFMAADLDTDALGLDSGNYWYTADADLEACYPTEAPNLDQIERFGATFVTLTSLKDQTKRKGNGHTLEAFTLLPYAPFARWEGTKHDERPADYLALKERLQAAMVRTAAQVVPGLEDALSFQELGTPLTNSWYAGATAGNMYGNEKTLGNLPPFGFGVRTEIEELLMCGASTTGHGVMGATQSGLLAAASVLQCRPSELLRRQGGSLRLVASDRPETWPADLQAKLHPSVRPAKSEHGLTPRSAR